MPRELNRFEADLIYDNEYRNLKEIEETMEPCDLYDNCEDCPNWKACGQE